MQLEIEFSAAKWLGCTIVILLCDLVFFGLAGKRAYPTVDVDWRYAIPAYLLISLCLSSIGVTSGESPALCGALVGLVIYGVFNSTEAAIRPDWRKGVTPFVDLTYGTALCTAVVSLNHWWSP
jgi:uncharacterized membrane protein